MSYQIREIMSKLNLVAFIQTLVDLNCYQSYNGTATEGE